MRAGVSTPAKFRKKRARPLSPLQRGALGFAVRRCRRVGRTASLPSLLGSGFRGFFAGVASVHAVEFFARNVRDRLPSRNALKYALGIL